MNTRFDMRPQTPEEVRGLSKELRAQHIDDAMVAFGELLSHFDDISRTLRIPNRFLPQEGDSEKVLESKYALIEKAFKSNRVFEAFLNQWLSKKYATSLARTLRKIIVDDEMDDKLLDGMRSAFSTSFENEMLSIQREPLEQALTPEIAKYLPSRLLVEVDPDGKIEAVTDLFANDTKNVEAKVATMRILLDKYNYIVDTIKKDLSSPDLSTRLKACIMMIIIETGIRPGNVGESNLKDEDGKEIRVDGEPIRVETFGASALKHSHIKRIIGGAVELEFRGKASTINRARVTTPEVVEIIKELAETAELRELYLETEGFMFTRIDPNVAGGEVVVSDSSLRAYFKKIVGDKLTPTDFRKLKATQTLFDSLKKQQRTLMKRIRDFAEEETEKLSERVAEEVSETINRAVEEAQHAINHSSTGVTINQYINPLVVLNYLERGGLRGQLRNAVMRNPEHLVFDPQVFLDNAGIGSRTASLYRMAFTRSSSHDTLESQLRALEHLFLD